MLEEIIKMINEISNIEIDENTELLEEILDSFGIINLILEIEKKYEIDLSKKDFSLKDFKTPKSIVYMIERFFDEK